MGKVLIFPSDYKTEKELQPIANREQIKALEDFLDLYPQCGECFVEFFGIELKTTGPAYEITTNPISPMRRLIAAFWALVASEEG